MKNYIERYIAEVARRLPLEIQDDVSQELHSNILDMLPSNPSDEDIEKVLYELGHPHKIALNYDKNRYVVAPELYQDYKVVLKVVLITLGIITLVITSLAALLSISDLSPWQAILHIFDEIIPAVFHVLLLGFTGVTIGFWIASRDSLIKKIKVWDVKNLPKLESKGKNVSRKRSIITLVVQTVFTLVYIYILLFSLDKFNWYANGVFVATLFGADIIKPFVPFIITAESVALSSILLLVIQKSYKLTMTILYTIGNLSSGILIVIVMNTQGFISQNFIDNAAIQTQMTSGEFSNILNTLFVIISVFLFSLIIIDIVVHWFRLYRASKQASINNTKSL